MKYIETHKSFSVFKLNDSTYTDEICGEKCALKTFNILFKFLAYTYFILYSHFVNKNFGFTFQVLRTNKQAYLNLMAFLFLF